ncbi:helix-turn-helix domain-containing protein [Thiothrix lacustris]|uniref:helix-turn-helix domain-containing protein n=1 Tax=Thiothrix lacustris TaxID=525917 RepID=UPI00048AAC46|nr:transcriptional regulator [Thiothrix lacustris]
MGSAFTSIKQGLEEAITFAKGNCPQAKVHQFSPVDVKNVRTKVGMTQIEFAATFGISVSVPCGHWERRDRTPHGAARVLLHVVAKEPQAVLRALAN